MLSVFIIFTTLSRPLLSVNKVFTFLDKRIIFQKNTLKSSRIILLFIRPWGTDVFRCKSVAISNIFGAQLNRLNSVHVL